MILEGNKRGVKASQTLAVNDRLWSSISGKCAFIEGSNMAAPLFSIFDVGSSNGAAGTKIKGLGPLHMEHLFVASLTHVSARISSCFHIFRVNGWSVLRWLAAIRPILGFTTHPGLHDNADTTTLSYLQTDGLSDKLIAWQLRKIPPPFGHALSIPHFPQPQPNPRFTRLQPSPSFSPQMSASTSPEYVTRVISPSPPALHADATVVRTVLRLLASN